MHRDNDLTFAPLFMLVSVNAAAALGQPFSKCSAFHCFAPMYPYVILHTQNYVEPLRFRLHWKLRHNVKILGRRFVGIRYCMKIAKQRRKPLCAPYSGLS